MLYPLHITRNHIYMFHTMNTFHYYAIKSKVFGGTAELSTMFLSPQSIFLVCSCWFPCLLSGFQWRGRSSVLWPEEGSHPETRIFGIWYRPLPSTRYWRFPWIAAAHGNVQRLSLLSFQVLWTIWTPLGHFVDIVLHSLRWQYWSVKGSKCFLDFWVYHRVV